MAPSSITALVGRLRLCQPPDRTIAPSSRWNRRVLTADRAGAGLVSHRHALRALLTAVRGLRHTDGITKMELARRIEGAKWLLWHGRQERCLQRLEVLRRETGWAGSRNPLGKLIRYIKNLLRPADRLQQALSRGSADFNQRRRVGGRLRGRPANEEEGSHALELPRRQCVAAGALCCAQRARHQTLQALISAGSTAG